LKPAKFNTYFHSDHFSPPRKQSQNSWAGICRIPHFHCGKLGTFYHLFYGVNGNVAHWEFAITCGEERQIPICAATILGGTDQKQKVRRVGLSIVVCFATSLKFICAKLKTKLNKKLTK